MKVQQLKLLLESPKAIAKIMEMINDPRYANVEVVLSSDDLPDCISDEKLDSIVSLWHFVYD